MEQQQTQIGGGVEAGRVLVIRSSEWYRGKGRVGSKPQDPHLSSALLTPAGTSCCLGIHARACGLPGSLLSGWGLINEALEGNGFDRERLPADYPWVKYYPKYMGGRWVLNGRAELAANINDDPLTTDEEKIAALRPIFAKHGITLDWRPDE